jgi:sigma-B regulation protein RsbU (phosphoserine phosphatase)
MLAPARGFTMIARRNTSESAADDGSSGGLHLDAFRTLVSEPGAWRALLHEERALAEFVEGCRSIVDHTDRLALDLKELQLVNESIIEHATEIENELELRSRIIGEDLAIAKQVQRALLPEPGGPISSQLEIAVYHRQLSEVGGDYYDFFTLPGDRHAIGVYDISGHGVSSALIMAFLKAEFLNATKRLDSASEIVDWVNRSCISFLREVKRYSTFSFVVFTEQFIRYVSGGGYGLLVHHGTACPFNRTGNFIGLRIKPFREFELPFEQGDILALYTDGVPEAQGANGESYSVQRMNDMIVRHSAEPAQVILDRCIEDYTRFRTEDTDDITLLILRRSVQ